MKITYQGKTLEIEVVIGNLTRTEFKGLSIWFSYDEPIAICYPTKAMINADAKASATTSRHINHVKRLYFEIDLLPESVFKERMNDLISGRGIRK